jgi:hypothetical protein
MHPSACHPNFTDRIIAPAQLLPWFCNGATCLFMPGISVLVMDASTVLLCPVGVLRYEVVTEDGLMRPVLAAKKGGLFCGGSARMVEKALGVSTESLCSRSQLYLPGSGHTARWPLCYKPVAEPGHGQTLHNQAMPMLHQAACTLHAAVCESTHTTD